MRRSKRVGAALVVAAVVLLAVAFVALLWRGAPWLDASRLRGLTPVQRQSAIDAIRGRLLQLAAGLVIVGGLVYTGMTFRLNREGQVTDRYTKAIEQLGSPLLDVRLGAIYALERIMIDSARDHPTIVEVLAAYIREHAPCDPRAPHLVAARRDARSPVHEPELPPQNESTTATAPVDVFMAPPRRPATDVEAALIVLGRRPPGRAERGGLDLAGTILSFMNLTGLKLNGANLRGADMTFTKLQNADLQRADLDFAYLNDAQLSHANLERAHVSHAFLSQAKLDDANLTGALLIGPVLHHAHMTGAKLVRAWLDHADLTQAILDYANLAGAHLRDADLSQAILDHANLTGADLREADLTGADLTEADLTEADLTGAKLKGAKLNGAKLKGAKLNGAKLDGAKVPKQ